MNFFILLATFSIELILAQNVPVSRQFYVLGDSISDTGNAFKASNFTNPDPKSYYRGRFSNGPVWPEYVARALRARLVNYAYGGATSDSQTYPVSASYDTPGCIQQADSFIKDYNEEKRENINFNQQVLTSVSFFGNDFFIPFSSPELSAYNINKCIRKILTNTDVRHMIIPTSSATELYPFFATQQTVTRTVASKIFKEYFILIQEKLKSLRIDFPGVNFYEFDSAKLTSGLANRSSSLLDHKSFARGSCISPLATTALLKEQSKCRNPNLFLFYDGLHPSTQFHQAIAQTILTQISN